MKHKHVLKVTEKPRGPKALYFRCSECGKLKGYRRSDLQAMLLWRIPFRQFMQVWGAWG